MPAPCRAACARLRPTLTIDQRIEIVFAELHAANGALRAATAGLSAALQQDLIDSGDVYELLRVIHLRLKQTIADAEQAALEQECRA
ncbi:hypothetical protein [Dyella sp.]|uniref:hypothetical protein n=1 Tax=Dyella sp. TaxID=1869338 RepID=UPI002B4726A0|nr:hypothetical protein [Dyella sp.]HKT28824.1 hypothetical protein [Dyella sp.]